MSEFEQFHLKTYNHWELFLHQHQFPYVGRCYAAAKRENAEKVTDMYSGEREELFHTIVPEWEKALRQIFGNFWPNFAILGNEWKHLHAHLIPRFDKTKKVYGVEFTDPNPNKNYAPYPEKELPLELLLQIRDDIASKL